MAPRHWFKLDQSFWYQWREMLSDVRKLKTRRSANLCHSTCAAKISIGFRSVGKFRVNFPSPRQKYLPRSPSDNPFNTSVAGRGLSPGVSSVQLHVGPSCTDSDRSPRQAYIVQADPADIEHSACACREVIAGHDRCLKEYRVSQWKYLLTSVRFEWTYRLVKWSAVHPTQYQNTSDRNQTQSLHQSMGL